MVAFGQSCTCMTLLNPPCAFSLSGTCNRGPELKPEGLTAIHYICCHIFIFGADEVPRGESLLNTGSANTIIELLGPPTNLAPAQAL
jgi:hypothetical protein